MSANEVLAAKTRLRTGRNEPYPCGSGKKCKKCCLERDETLVRQAVVAGQTVVATNTHREKVDGPDPDGVVDALAEIETAVDDRDLSLPADREPKFPADVEAALDAVWADFQVDGRPSEAEMDALLERLLALPHAATNWNDLFGFFAKKGHLDLPRVFQRIADAVPATKETGAAYFYWGAVEEFDRIGRRDLLPAVAARFGALDGKSYDSEALAALTDYLLAAGFAAEALALAERLLPVVSADEELFAHVAEQWRTLIFDLRVGERLRVAIADAVAPERMADELRRELGDDVAADFARHAADVITGCLVVAGTRREFDLEQGDIGRSQRAWRDAKRLYGVLMHVAREAGPHAHPASACALRGLLLMRDSVYDWLNTDPQRRRKASWNLLDYLSPADMEPRLVNAARAMIGINRPRARQLLDGHDALLRFAQRHDLISAVDAAATEAELRRHRETIDAP